uniref:Swi3 domain-containing protein n=1 Tax=Panagrellus redivivus TaxID=6233 RepID=A0A7E4W0B0_PANRE
MSNVNQRSLLSQLLFSVDDDDTASSSASSSSVAPTPLPMAYIPKSFSAVSTVTPYAGPIAVPRNTNEHKSGPAGVVKRRRRNYRNPKPEVATNVARIQRVRRPTEDIVLTQAQAEEIERCKQTLRGFGFQNPDAAYQQMTLYFRYILPRLRLENIPTGRDDDLPVTDEMLHYHFSKVMAQQPQQQQEEVELPL